MNPVTGEKEVTMGGQRYVLRFTWRALAEIEKKHGEHPDMFDPETVASVAAAGMRERHPDMTSERIMDLSPPLVPFARAVQEALAWAYFGGEAVPEDAAAKGKKKDPREAGPWRLFGWPFRRASAPPSSGA